MTLPCPDAVHLGPPAATPPALGGGRRPPGRVARGWSGEEGVRAPTVGAPVAGSLRPEVYAGKELTLARRSVCRGEHW